MEVYVGESFWTDMDGDRISVTNDDGSDITEINRKSWNGLTQEYVLVNTEDIPRLIHALRARYDAHINRL